MSSPGRYLFDECISPRVAAELKTRLKLSDELKSLQEIYFKGTSDRDLVNELSGEPDWVIITQDAGKGAARGGRLPDLCKSLNVRHVILNPRELANEPLIVKLAVLAITWPLITTIREMPRGSRCILGKRKNSTGNGWIIDLKQVQDSP